MAFDSTSPLLAVNDFSEEDSNILKLPKMKSKWSELVQARYILILLCFFGTFSIYAIRVSLSIGIVCMVNHTAILRHTRQQNNTNLTISSCLLSTEPVSSNNSREISIDNEDGPFVWDEQVQGTILSSFFWGYVTTQLAAGYLADKYGAKWVWGLTLLTSSLLTMIIPFAARIGPTFVICIQIINGAAQGFTFPAVYSMISKWTTLNEKATMVTLGTLGVPLGTVATYSLAPVLCKSQLFDGWPSLFYVIDAIDKMADDGQTSFFGIVWFILWSFLIYDHPSMHPWISEREKLYIETGNMCTAESHLMKVPWKRILKSTPLYALCICDFCQCFKYFMILTHLPTYLKVVLNFNLQENGIISSVNPILSPVFAVFFSWIADYFIRRKIMGIAALRKSTTFADSFVTSICLMMITMVACQKTEIVVLLLISSFMENLSTTGVNINPYDLSPNFTGIIKGFQQTSSALAGIFAPYVIGVLTKNNNTKSAWDVAFYIASGLYLFGGLVFVIFGSGDIQPWNNGENSSPNDGGKEDDEYVIIYARENKVDKGK